jgi:hypothetical protein
MTLIAVDYGGVQKQVLEPGGELRSESSGL